MSRAWRSGSTTAWRRTRANVILRDIAAGWGCRTHEEGWCQRANTNPHTCTHRPEQAHHLDGVTAGRHNLDRIVTACRTCNQVIGDPNRGSDDPQPQPMTRW